MTESDLRVIADLTAEVLGIASPTVEIRQRARGAASQRRNRVILPQRLLEHENEAYVIWYVIHEVSHIAAPAMAGHGPEFKAVETQALAIWGYRPEYARAYVKKLWGPGEEIAYEKKDPYWEIRCKCGFVKTYAAGQIPARIRVHRLVEGTHRDCLAVQEKRAGAFTATWHPF